MFCDVTSGPATDRHGHGAGRPNAEQDFPLKRPPSHTHEPLTPAGELLQKLLLYTSLCSTLTLLWLFSASPLAENVTGLAHFLYKNTMYTPGETYLIENASYVMIQ